MFNLRMPPRHEITRAERALPGPGRPPVVDLKPEKMKHTPGPWYPVQYSGYFDVQNGPLYSDTSVSNIEYDENAEANATLMATAPELLDVLKKTLDYLEEIEATNFYLVEEINEVIKKATE